MAIEYEDDEGSFFYFDGQWDVIKRGTARQYKGGVDEYTKNNQRLASVDSTSTKKFLPRLKDVNSDTSQHLELFENNSDCICHLNDCAIEAVAEALVRLKDGVSERLQPAGYTYFAQLLTHDIVSSTSLLRTREASSALNLDSVYFEYDQILGWKGADSHGKFVICNDETDLHRADWQAGALRKKAFKIPRLRTEPYYFAVIPDHRNDGNVILSQLHVLLQKLHNEVVELLAEEVINHKGDRQGVSGKKYYEKARDIVILLFQQATISDLLSRTLDQDTFDYYFSYQGPSLFPELQSKGVVPKEFTHAVSRYAHSMIRPNYFLNEHNGYHISVEKLFKKNTPLKSDKENLIISDWRWFFSMHWQANGVKTKNKANKIELNASNLPVSSGPLEMGEEPTNPTKNLATFDITASSKLCTYSKVMKNKEIQDFLSNVKGIEHPKEDYFGKIDYSSVNNKLKDLGIKITLDNANAPFLVSMYLESSVMPQKHNEDRLGVVGSIVYAETVRMSIEHAEVNIMQDEIDLQSSLTWAYPVYQSILRSLGSVTMMGLSTFKH
jgi:hypothetical protein